MATMQLLTDSFAEHAAMDVAVSHAVLAAVAAGELGPVFRLHQTQPVLAFGAADRRQPGYRQAVRVAEAHGYAAVQRLAGGRAAVFHRQTLGFSMAVPAAEPVEGIESRFEMIAGVMADSFKDLGLDARIGEVPGEYCPGKWSVSIGGRIKVMGVGQRLVRRAAHVGGVVVVDGGEWIKDVLVPVYRRLRIDWDPRTAGALANLSPGLTGTRVARAIVDRLSQRFELRPAVLPESVVNRARDLIPEHIPVAA